MAIVEALQSAQFVVNGQGQHTAVVMDIQAWDTLIAWFEDAIDTKIAAQSLTWTSQNQNFHRKGAEIAKKKSEETSALSASLR